MSKNFSFADLTELPNAAATQEQLDMMVTRYAHAADLCDGGVVVEHACGPGIGLGILSEKAHQVIARDIDPRLVEMALESYQDRFDIAVGDACNMDLPDDSVDVVILFEAIYYLSSPSSFYAEARRVLKPSGKLFVCSANPERPDFNPSPHVHGYYTIDDLRNMAIQAGFNSCSQFGCFRTEEGSRSFLGHLRWFAVRYRLIPGSMRLKALLKRLLFSKTIPLPHTLSVTHGTVHELIPSSSQAPRAFKVIYQICTA